MSARRPGREQDPAAAVPGLAELIEESYLLLGAGSSVLLQLAMWGVGRGVAEHSDTLARPVDRLRTTLTYVYVMALGTEDERRLVARLVNKAHVPVKGEGYTAFDPELQLWVAATLAHNGIFLCEKLHGPLPTEAKERLYRDSQVFGTALQVRPEDWPADHADFERYWRRTLATLRSDDVVRDYARRLLATSEARWFVRPLLPLQSLMARGNIGAEVRAVLGLPWTRRDQRRYDLFWRAFRVLYPRVPRPVRTLHARLVMRDFRRRMRGGRRVI